MISTKQFHAKCDTENIRLEAHTPADIWRAFGESEFWVAVLQKVPFWLMGSEGQEIKVNAFLDVGTDSTYIRDDVTADHLRHKWNPTTVV